MSGAFGALVVLLVLLGGLVGHHLLAGMRTTLVHHPRRALIAWTVLTTTWAGFALAAGPILAWSSSARLLPGHAGEVCRRCVAAANPFGVSGWSTGLPAGLLIAVPAVALVWSAARGIRTAVQNRRLAREHKVRLDMVGEPRLLGDDQVWVLPASQPAAYSLPFRRGRIVVTQGAVEALDPVELAAVLAHERAHVRERHHLLLAWFGVLGSGFGWVPLIRHAEHAARSYAEMAADDAASRAAHPQAVARALARLRLLSAQDGSPTTPAIVLHAVAGEAEGAVSERVLRLLQPPKRGGSSAAHAARMFVLTGYTAVATLAIVLAGAPYVAMAASRSC